MFHLLVTLLYIGSYIMGHANVLLYFLCIVSYIHLTTVIVVPGIFYGSNWRKHKLCLSFSCNELFFNILFLENVSLNIMTDL